MKNKVTLFLRLCKKREFHGQKRECCALASGENQLNICFLFLYNI